jgi:hypothetical protein
MDRGILSTEMSRVGYCTIVSAKPSEAVMLILAAWLANNPETRGKIFSAKPTKRIAFIHATIRRFGIRCQQRA